MYRVRLQDFEGPMDLLYFFIKRDEIDIFDIPIARIADEYLDYVRLLEKIDLDSVGDFLYMAALLINIKARMLLPSQEVDEEGEPIDPRRELVERLLEYVRYKEASQTLTRLQEERNFLYARLQHTEANQYRESGIPFKSEASIFDLISALRRILTESVEEPVHGIEAETYSVEEQQELLRQQMKVIPRIHFRDHVCGKTKGFIIATFIALLELVRLGEAGIIVTSNAFDFIIESTNGEPQKTNGRQVNGVP